MKRDQYVQNTYRVKKSEWDRWSLLSKNVFNMLYTAVVNQPHRYLPRGVEVDPDVIDVLAWNIAMTAASMISRGEKHFG